MKARESKLDPYAEKLQAWFTSRKEGGEGITLMQAQNRLAELGLKVSVNTLSCWWQQHQQSRLRDKMLSDIASGAQFNRELEKSLGDNPPPELQTLIKLIRTLVAQLAIKGSADADSMKLVRELTALVLDYEKSRGSHALKTRELEFDEKKFAASLKTKIEHGLDALFEEIKTNAEARSLFEKFKAVVTSATT